MLIKDTFSRLLHFAGNYNLEEAFTKGRQRIPLDDGRVRYLVRLELAPLDNQELRTNYGHYNVHTTWGHVPYDFGTKSYDLSGIIPFENFNLGLPPQKRAINTNHLQLQAELAELITESYFDFNAYICSTIDGRQFSNRNNQESEIDNQRTYQPVFTAIVNDIRSYLSSDQFQLEKLVLGEPVLVVEPEPLETLVKPEEKDQDVPLKRFKKLEFD